MKKMFAAILAAVMLLSGCGSAAAPAAIAQPAYPEMAPYPDEMSYFNQLTGEFDSEGFDIVYSAWRDDRRSQYDQPEGYADGLEDYFLTSIPEYLADPDDANAVCSPLNIYMALAILAECTGGSSRQQILELLNSDSIESLRTQAGHIWNAHYCTDGGTALTLANSLWLDEDLTYETGAIQTLAEAYYASAYQGQLGSEEMNQALQTWLNEQTGGLLEKQVQNIQMDPQTVLALASTIRYQVKWASEFNESRNTDGIFHAPGGDIGASFMNKELSYGPYYWGESYAAAYLGLEDGGKMWLILPDKGKTPADVLETSAALDMILNCADTYGNQKSIRVNLSIPKFDIISDIKLNEKLQALGITDVFGDTADFTPILPQQQAFLDKAQHTVRVAIDEEGISAAAYTVMMSPGAAMPPDDEVDFILDRPFIFMITSRDNLPLFAGIVNNP